MPVEGLERDLFRAVDRLMRAVVQRLMLLVGGSGRTEPIESGLVSTPTRSRK